MFSIRVTLNKARYWNITVAKIFATSAYKDSLKPVLISRMWWTRLMLWIIPQVPQRHPFSACCTRQGRTIDEAYHDFALYCGLRILLPEGCSLRWQTGVNWSVLRPSQLFNRRKGLKHIYACNIVILTTLLAISIPLGRGRLDDSLSWQRVDR